MHKNGQGICARHDSIRDIQIGRTGKADALFINLAVECNDTRLVGRRKMQKHPTASLRIRQRKRGLIEPCLTVFRCFADTGQWCFRRERKTDRTERDNGVCLLVKTGQLPIGQNPTGLVCPAKCRTRICTVPVIASVSQCGFQRCIGIGGRFHWDTSHLKWV